MIKRLLKILLSPPVLVLWIPVYLFFYVKNRWFTKYDPYDHLLDSYDPESEPLAYFEAKVRHTRDAM